MGQLYGDRWVQRWGTAVSDLWRIALEDIAPPTIEAGMRALVRSADRYLPTPGRFRELCLESAARPRPSAPRTPFANSESDEYTDARRACLVRYHDRLTAGMLRAPQSAPYDGDFPVDAVVAAAPWVDIVDVRRMATTENQHAPEALRDAYRAMLRLFEAEWREYARA